jgi:alkylhydroperoxidase/carboxymuconolactone decarboxylase family protein YurZ
MEKSTYETFQSECPKLAAKFNELVQVQSTMTGLDQKTKQLINIAIQTSNKNPVGVKMHAIMAKKMGPQGTRY